MYVNVKRFSPGVERCRYDIPTVTTKQFFNFFFSTLFGFISIDVGSSNLWAHRLLSSQQQQNNSDVGEIVQIWNIFE